jgi:hypothetical protein
MRIGKIRSLTVAFLRLLLTLPLLLALSGGAEGKKKPPPTPWTGPVPKADCGPNDRVETGLQGQTSLFERTSGLSELGFNCNLELVGQFQGEGAGYGAAWFDHCAYYSTFSPANMPSLQQHRGVVVVDASDPRNPQVTDYLTTPTMLDPHESLKVHQRRQLLAGVERNGPGFAIYDLSADCRHPVLKASVPIRVTGAVVEPVEAAEEEHDAAGHAGNFTPDGLTYYGTNTRARTIYAIDVTDPANPTYLGTFPHNSHDTYFSEDGTRAYLTQIGAPAIDPSRLNGLVILDVSDIQFRRPNPEVRVISTLFWNDGGTAQQALPVTIRGRPYLIFTDERGAGGGGAGKAFACAQGLAPHGFARIIDISDETNPKIISKLMLEVNDPANCAEVLNDPDINSYSSHYCNVDKAHNPTILACSWREGGLRVFDIRDPVHPREIAYYKPPARRTAFLPGSRYYWDWMNEGPGGEDRTGDETPSNVRFVKHKGETHLWFTSQDNGFQIVRFTKRLKALLRDARDDDEDDGKRGRDNGRRERDRDDDD